MAWMKRIELQRIAFLVCLSAFTALAAGAQTKRDAVRKIIGALRCSEFEWLSQGGREKYALAVPVTISGRKYKYQLDTGSPHTFIYGTEAARWGWAKGQRSVGVRDLRFGGAGAAAAKLHVKEERRPGRTGGTLGLDLLLGHVVVLDYPGRLFCLVPGESVPADLRRRTSWVPAEILNGKFFVHTRLNGQELDHIFFDTGASLLPLAVDFESWKTLTGRAGEAEATTKMTVNSWGKPAALVGAPAVGALEVGEVRLERPVIYYWGNEPGFFRKWFRPATGLIGNLPFWDEVVVLDLGERPAFGILR
jgi:hypothetical protein